MRYHLEDALSLWISELRRGFLPGRLMLQNTIGVDHEMHLASLNCPDRTAIFYDLQTAFPSVSHDLFLAVLRALKVPIGILTFTEN